MSTRQYIGARYVIKVYENSQNANSAEWEANTYYEPLVMVTYNNSSYLSKKDVPATVGNPAQNPSYWVITGAYNGQIANLQNQIDEINEKDNSIFYTPQMFGAKGDGVTDDTQALQDCIDNAFRDRVRIIIPSGVYNFTSITIHGAAFNDDNFIPEICGIDRNTTTLKHIGSGDAITVDFNSGGNYVDGLHIHDLFIEGNNNTTNIIVLARGTNYYLHDLRLTNASECGLKNTNDMWVSTFERIRIVSCATGIKFSGNSVTSISYNEIYVYSATVFAFNITGRYSNIGVLAADNCTGSYVYNFYWFSGAISALGMELSNTTDGLIKFDNSTVDISQILAHKPTFGTDVIAPLWLSNSSINIDDIVVSSDPPASIATPIASMYASSLFINNSERSTLLFDKAVDRASNTSLFSYKNNKMVLYSHRAFIGADHNLPSNIQNSDYVGGVTIYTDCTNSPRYTADNTDQQYRTPAKIGDWFIENKPTDRYAAAYVILGDTTGNIANTPFCFIPIIKSGATNVRPNDAPIGAYFFDTTLNKPIWYNGTNWVDATGTTV